MFKPIVAFDINQYNSTAVNKLQAVCTVSEIAFTNQLGCQHAAVSTETSRMINGFDVLVVCTHLPLLPLFCRSLACQMKGNKLSHIKT
jgi:hypothetical protein